jgi:hypothetical protein
MAARLTGQQTRYGDVRPAMTQHQPLSLSYPTLNRAAQATGAGTVADSASPWTHRNASLMPPHGWAYIHDAAPESASFGAGR